MQAAKHVEIRGYMLLNNATHWYNIGLQKAVTLGRENCEFLHRDRSIHYHRIAANESSKGQSCTAVCLFPASCIDSCAVLPVWILKRAIHEKAIVNSSSSTPSKSLVAPSC